MNVLMFSPGFPAEMPYFTRGLARVGARVIGIGDQPSGALPDVAKDALSDYIQVRNLWDEDSIVAEVREAARRLPLDRVECLWEPGMLLAARLREELDLPGLTVEQTIPFRDKERMKQVLDAAGVRTPRHRKATTEAEMRSAAEEIGYPLCVKPISGAGSADTYRVDDEKELDRVIGLVGHVDEVSVEEFIEGEEYTFDTICAGGEILYENIAWYRPKVLIARTTEWISPQTMNLRDLEADFLADGRMMGRQVLKALGYETGFTHMEWFIKPDGETVFGEIGARPPGARSTEIMNYGSDIDVFTGWAEAVCRGSLSQKIDRKYNAAVIFKRAQGQGLIRKIEGLEPLLAEFGDYVTCVNLTPVGAPRRNWKQTLVGDGYIILRHPHLETAMAMADKVGESLQLYAAP